MVLEVTVVAPGAKREGTPTSSPKALTNQQYALLFRYIREALPLSHLVADVSFAQSFPQQQIPAPVNSVMQRSLEHEEDVLGFLLRLKAPVVGRIVSRFHGRRVLMGFADLEQDAKLKLLELFRDLSAQGRVLPSDVEGYLRTSLKNFLSNKAKHDRIDRRRVLYSVEAFEDKLGKMYSHSMDTDVVSGLDFLMEHHKDETLNQDAYQDVQEAVGTREFWREVDQEVGSENRSALVDAHVLELSQRVVAMRLGRTYRGARDHLMKQRARLRSAQSLREQAGDEPRATWHKGRRRRGETDAKV